MVRFSEMRIKGIILLFKPSTKKNILPTVQPRLLFLRWDTANKQMGKDGLKLMTIFGEKHNIK